MPELAEVEHSRRTWDPGVGDRVVAVDTRFDHARPFRGTDVTRLREALAGTVLRASEASGKQLCFRFGGPSAKTADKWLGIHLGMAGHLERKPAAYVAEKHDLVIVRQKKRSLVFTDLRHFGRVLFHEGSEPPLWWSSLAPSILSPAFTREVVAAFLAKRKRTAIKPVLLMQERFPGVGNWMADEILWRARIAPTTLAGHLDNDQIAALYRKTRFVCRASIESMDEDWEYPRTWLFAHRWKDGGACPRCHGPVTRVLVGGRMTCSCRVCQPEARRAALPETNGLGGSCGERTVSLARAEDEKWRCELS